MGLFWHIAFKKLLRKREIDLLVLLYRKTASVEILRQFFYAIF